MCLLAISDPFEQRMEIAFMFTANVRVGHDPTGAAYLASSRQSVRWPRPTSNVQRKRNINPH